MIKCQNYQRKEKPNEYGEREEIPGTKCLGTMAYYSGSKRAAFTDDDGEAYTAWHCLKCWGEVVIKDSETSIGKKGAK